MLSAFNLAKAAEIQSASDRREFIRGALGTEPQVGAIVTGIISGWLIGSALRGRK